MDSNKLKKKSFFDSRIIVVFFALAVCFTSGHAMQTVNASLQGIIVPVFICLAAPILKGVAGKKINVHSLAVLIFTLMIAMTAIVDFGRSISMYFMLFMFIATAFGMTLVYSFDDFVKVYLNVMTVVAAVGIVGYYLVNIADALSFLPSYSNVNNVEYKIGWIFNYITIVPERNCGMFWEPGLFATNLILALVFEIAFKKTKMSILRIALFSWAVITTNSSAGFLLLFCCAWLLFTKERRAKKKTGKEWTKNTMFSNFVKLILFVFGFVIILNLDNIINATILGDNEYVMKLLSENVSASSRARAILFNLEMFIKNPIAGAGYSAVAGRMDFVADTSTSLYIMSVFGILGSLYTILWVYGICRRKNLNVLSKILICIIILSIINKEPHLNILLTWIIFFYVLKDNGCESGGNNGIEEAS